MEPHPELRLDVHPLDVQFDPPEAHVRPDVQLEEVQHLRLQGDMGFEVVDLQVQFVDMESGNVQEDVRPALTGPPVRRDRDLVSVFRVLPPAVGAVRAGHDASTSSIDPRPATSRPSVDRVEPSCNRRAGRG